jgi:hypothetical protein
MGNRRQVKNKTGCKITSKNFVFLFNLPYAKALENYSREELREKFDFVIQNNNWDKDDEVIAIGDY